MKNTRWLVIVLAVSLCSTPLMAKERRLLMASLGDSMTVAALADVALPAQSRVEEEDIQVNLLNDNRETLSWSSGKKIQSHFVRLQKWFKSRGESAPLSVLNVAENGNRAADLLKQADKVIAAMRTGDYESLRYVTILIGANDACSKVGPEGTPSAEMRQSILDALAKLATIPALEHRSQPEPIHVLIGLLPQVSDLGAESVRKAHTLLGMSCEDLRQGKLHFCDPLLTWRSSAEHAIKAQIINDKNTMLQNVALEGQRRFPGLDIHVGESFSRVNITLPMMAADCFHPNAKAQAIMAEGFWADQPWFR